MKYDDASWHYGGDFPQESPAQYGGTHIGLFLRWCFTKGWAGQLHLEEGAEDVQRVIDGALSGTEYLFTYCDEKFTDEDLNEEGNSFAQRYYGSRGLYLDDYTQHFGALMYVAPEGAHDFQVFSGILEARLKSGILTRNPWWKFW